MKFLLLRVIVLTVLNLEELETVLVKIESILNSRPLGVVKSADSFNPITPAHLLIGSSFQEVPLREDSHHKLSDRFRAR